MECRDTLDYVASERGVRQSRFRTWCLNECGCNRIDSDVVLTPFHRQALGQVRNPGLCHAIHGFRRKRHKPRLRTHVYDASALLANHHSSGRLTRKKCAFEIHPQGQIKIFFTYIFRKVFRRQPCVVYEEVESPEMRSRILNRSRDLIEVCHVHLQGQHPPADSLNLSCQLTPGFHIPQSERYIGTSMSKSQRNSAAQAATSTSH